MARDTMAKRIRRRLYGVVFLAVLGSLVALSIAVYNKAFITVATVTLETDRTGNQLLVSSDVKVRGVLVGEVREVSSKGSGARITLALQPDKTHLIPSNVTARLLPKTLFGERYVALQVDSTDRTSRSIKGGDTIKQDQSAEALEIDRVLADIMPVLDALHPAELSATLNAISQALRGRGEQLGQNLSLLNEYLRQLNPSVPQLVDDIDKLGQVAQVYNSAAPELLATFSNFQTTATTIVTQRQALDSLLVSARTTADVLNQFLTENGDRLISVADSGSQILALLAKYSPEYTCLFAGLARQAPLLDKAFSGGLHITLEIVQSKGKYVPGNEPRTVTGVGPQCYGLPNPAVPFPGVDFADGAPATGPTLPSLPVPASVTGSETELSMVKSIIAAGSGTTPDDVSDSAAMLTAPLLRGNTVSVVTP